MNLLITADWHIRSDNPLCRKDDFFDIQLQTLDFIYAVAKKNKAVVVVAGDIFDKPQPKKAQELECLLQKYFCSIPTMWIAGNHDTLYHNYDNHNKTSLGVLEVFNSISSFNLHNNEYYFDYSNFKQDKSKSCLDLAKYNIMLRHIYCELDQLPEYIESGVTAKMLLENNIDYDLIITGDNHKGFYYQSGNKFVINPGCITRQKGDMRDYKPHVYLFDTDTREISKIYLPDNDLNAVSNMHNIEKKEKKAELRKLITSFNCCHYAAENIEMLIDEMQEKNEISQSIIDYMRLCVEHKENKIIEKLLEYWDVNND